MEISKVTPREYLVGLFSQLAAAGNVFFDVMNAPTDTTPPCYVLVRSGMTDAPQTGGDGVTTVRRANCDAIVSCRGTADGADFDAVSNSVENVLKNAGIVYSSFFLGYNFDTDRTERTFSFSVQYWG